MSKRSEYPKFIPVRAGGFIIFDNKEEEEIYEGDVLLLYVECCDCGRKFEATLSDKLEDKDKNQTIVCPNCGNDGKFYLNERKDAVINQIHLDRPR
jgi:DNA-directed RNA polymerase subunit RPC12/RpoP